MWIFTVWAVIGLVAHLAYCFFRIRKDFRQGEEKLAAIGVVTTSLALLAIGWWFFLMGLAGSSV